MLNLPARQAHVVILASEDRGTAIVRKRQPVDRIRVAGTRSVRGFVLIQEIVHVLPVGLLTSARQILAERRALVVAVGRLRHGWPLGRGRCGAVIFAENEWVVGILAVRDDVRLIAPCVGTSVVSVLDDTGILDGLEAFLAVCEGDGAAVPDDRDRQLAVAEDPVRGVTGTTVEAAITSSAKEVSGVKGICHV